MPIIRDGKNLVGGSRNGKALQSVYVGDKLAWSAGPRFPVVFDSLGTGGARTNNGTISWTHSASGEDRFVLVAAVAYINLTNQVADISSVTYGGSPMLRLGQNMVGEWGRAVMFGMWDPPTGSQSVTVTCSGTSTGTGYVANSVSYTNVADCTVHPGPAISGTGAGSFDHVVPSAPLHRVVNAWGGNAVFTAYGPSGALLWNSSAGNLARMLLGDVEGAEPSVEFTAVDNGGSRFSIAADLSPKN